jgi:hypothetical protein
VNHACGDRFEGKMRGVIRRPALLLCAALAACAHSPAKAPAESPAESPAAPDPTAYFPLAVGNEWTWIDRSPVAGEAAPKRRTVRIVSRDAQGFFVDDGRGALKVAHGCIQDRVRRILCAPFDVDRSWISIVSETSTERYQIAASGLTAAVPAGTFEDCILVRARNRAGDDAEVILETTYAPGVGPVRIETFALVGGKKVPQVKAELASHRIVRPSR